MNYNNLEKKETFFYFIWGKEFYWNNLIISIILLRDKYPENKVVVVSYTQDVPNYFYKYSKILNFNFIITECYFSRKYKNLKNMGPKVGDLDNFYDTHRKLSSKVIDCLEMAEKEDRVVLLDSDVFIIRKFNNIDWNKIGVFIIGKYNFNPNKDPDDYVIHANTGVITFENSSENAKKYKELFKKEIENLVSGSFKQSEYIIKTCGKAWLEWRCLGLADSLKITKEEVRNQIESDKSDGFWIQEEMITRRLIDNYENLFHNIGWINNGFVFLQGDKRTEDKNNIIKYNNIHLFNFLNYNISPLIINIKYFKNKIINKLEDDHINNLILPPHLKEIASKLNQYLETNKRFL